MEKIYRNSALVLVLTALAAALAACGSSSDGTATGAGPTDPPLSGTGSGLIAPLMTKWRAGYEEAGGDGPVSYHAAGNGMTIEPVGEGKVDFVDQDAPISVDQFNEVGIPVSMVPWAMTAVAVVYNVHGVPNGLKLNGAVLGHIFGGGVTRWNDPAIAKLNPGTVLPDVPITVVHRSDESAEDYVVSNLFSETSKQLERRFGIISRNIAVSPAVSMKKKGHQAVANAVAHTNGALGYLALPYAQESGLDIAQLETGSGHFVRPTPASIAAGGEVAIRVGPNREIWVTKEPRSAKAAYPMITFSYAVIPWETKLSGPLKKFLLFTLSPKGQEIAEDAGFVAVPERILKANRKTAKRIYYAYG
jgi:phosphate transport system substrate-binding protein